MLEQFGFIEILIIVGFVILLIGFIILCGVAVKLKKANEKPLGASQAGTSDPGQNNIKQAIKVQPAQPHSTAQADQTLIAVLTAAVAACLGTSPNGLQIKSYRRLKNGNPSWRQAGRMDYMNNH